MTLQVLSISPVNGAQNIGEDEDAVIVLKGSIPLTGVRVYLNGDLSFAKGRDPDNLTSIDNRGAIYPDYVGLSVPKALDETVTVRVRSRQQPVYSGKVTITGKATTSTNMVTNDTVSFSATYYVRPDPLTNVRPDVRDTPISKPLPERFLVSSAFQGVVRSLLCTVGAPSFYLSLLREVVNGEVRSLTYFLNVNERDERDARLLRRGDIAAFDVNTASTQLMALSPLWESFMTDLASIGVIHEIRQVLSGAWNSGNTLSRLSAASAALLFINQGLK